MHFARGSAFRFWSRHKAVPESRWCVSRSLQADAHPIFEQAACYGKAVAVKAAAIDALAITVFTASNDAAVVDKCMAGFANLWKSGMQEYANYLHLK